MTQTHPLLKPNDSTITSKVGMSSTSVHPDDVLDWRISEFLRMGFSEHDSYALASTRVDTHAMDDLLKKGCAAELAWRILMGTMWSGPDPLWVDSDDGGYIDVPFSSVIENHPETEDEDDGA